MGNGLKTEKVVVQTELSFFLHVKIGVRWVVVKCNDFKLIFNPHVFRYFMYNEGGWPNLNYSLQTTCRNQSSQIRCTLRTDFSSTRERERQREREREREHSKTRQPTQIFLYMCTVVVYVKQF